jgi:enoyl-CoA hydratase
MGDLVAYDRSDAISTITMDDGKVNALSLEMLAGLGAALDRAEADMVAVVLAGRAGTLSAGFDLRVLRGGGSDAFDMLMGGFALSVRMLTFPTPVVVACTGHAIAMASFLLLSADYRIGASGPFRIGANEVAIGLTMPLAAVEICRARLAPAHFNRSVVNAEMYGPAGAVEAGFLDRVVDEADLVAAAQEAARALATLDMTAHAATKLRARAQALSAIRSAVEEDEAFLRTLA